MLKIGDKVKMTPQGFKFYANLDIQFDMCSVGEKMDERHFTQAVCEQFAIHGVGVVKKFNKEQNPYIRWDFAIDGMKYHYTHYFQNKDVRKLTLLEKIMIFLKGSC
jgi:hypothetical protein